MRNFLYLLARDIAADKNPERLTVVFPNKRAGLFLARELVRQIKRPTWMPAIVTIEEFVEKYAGLRRADDITLIIKLYRAYRACSGSLESFDDFYPWGSALLEDFDDVDKYLVDARDLFSNVRALREIEKSFPYLSAEQVKHIRQFWSHFRGQSVDEAEKSRGPEQEAFLKTWDCLYPTYKLFQEELRREGLCHEGMGARILLDHLDEAPSDERFFFAGFNALTKCEEQILARFRDNGQATFYWDHDLYYTGNNMHEAGFFLRDNLKRFPNALGIEHFNNLRREDKRIEHISVSSTVGQAKLLPALIEELAGGEPADTAIVLCDEKLLAPVLHSIPRSVEKINVTMGYPARETASAALLALAAELQRGAGKEGFAGKTVAALLDHPFVQAGAPDEARETARRVDRLPRASPDMLRFDELSRVLFTRREEASFDYFLDIISCLLARPRGVDAIERETLFTFYKKIRQARDAFAEEQIAPGERLHARVVNQLTRSITVPFSGEPLEGMQVMGLLETRVLDFKNLIILSANEGTLPRRAPFVSFIPYNLRLGFGMPTPEHRDAIDAYYFYRVMQRAEHVKILHADRQKNDGEMSRFLYQLKYERESPPRERFLREEISARVSRPVEVQVNNVIERLSERFSRTGRGISPSAINAYLDCRLRFYFKYVAGIREREKPTGELDHRVLGNIFHETTRALYLSFPNGEVTPEDITRMARDELMIEQYARDAREKVISDEDARVVQDGTGELALAVVKKYVRKVLEHDRVLAPFRILALEQPVGMNFRVGDRDFRLEGNIDRVDQVGSTVRVIDYKTGADKGAFKSIASLFDPENKQRDKAAFQTILYCILYAREHPDATPPRPGLYSMRALFAPKYDDRFLFDGAPVDDLSVILPEFQEHLAGLLDEIFSPGQAFAMTAHREKCRSCPYSAICL
jgi:CRISPR/Cas system-associated exonuclease Cas4 (RecB family)